MIIIIIFIFARQKFQNLLDSTNSEDLKIQGLLLRKDPESLQFIVPKEGSFNFPLTVAQIIRNSLVLFITFSVLQYLSDSRAKGFRKIMLRNESFKYQQSKENSFLQKGMQPISKKKISKSVDITKDRALSP
eukprot:snap_masked-scaffold_26-processed-gene-0.37-mRNA-1 protein AED:1.00 eAED:1.00 QI:0/0/0/0/1/1/2/0/131